MISLIEKMKFTRLLILLISVLAGCATTSMMGALSEGDTKIKNDFYSKPILTDEIVAIGRPDPELSKKLHNDHVVAFLGEKNTYLLYKGGEELEQISKLNLDEKRMDIDADRSHNLFLKDKQVWGVVTLTYHDESTISASELDELEKAGFSEIKNETGTIYQKQIKVEGVVYPALQLSNAQMSKLTVHRTIALFNPGDAKPPMNTGYLLLPGAVAIDVVLTPVYLVVGVVYLVESPFKNNHDQTSAHQNYGIGTTEYEVSQILVGTEDEANAVEEMLSKGVDFAKLAKEKSIDVGSSQNGGEMGWASLDAYPIQFADAVLNLKKGEISKPVQTKYGWHIIKLDDTREVGSNR